MRNRGMLAAILGAACALLLAPIAASSARTATSATTSTTSSVTLEGVYTEVHGDGRYVDQTLYFLETPSRTYRLKVLGKPEVRSRTRVKVTGTLTGDTLDVGPLKSPSGAPSLVPTSAAPPIAAIGSKRVLAINVKWSGATLTATTAQEQNFLFGTDTRSVASFYKEASYGQLTWTGAITSTFTITDPAACDLSGLATSAETAATNNGYDLSSYDAIIVNAPKLYCGAAGYGEIGGKRTWIQDGLWNLADGYAREVPTHEIGHSLGLYHSHGLECASATATSTCLDNPGSHNEEYGNAFDVMGNNWPGNPYDAVSWFSAKQELALGWLSGSRVNNVAATGTYPLVPLEKQSASSPQVLVLATPNHTYYVEYREAIGQDAFLANYPAATNSVHVNVRTAFGADTGPFALDFAPQSDTTPGYYDWFDAPLPTGHSFTDPEGKFTITPRTVNGTTATVDVTLRILPAAPTIGSATAGTGQATVSWTAPTTNGGPPVSAYLVTPYIGTAAQTSRRFNDTATSHTITGLTKGTSYTFKVAAANSIGTGPQSAASNAVKPK